MATANNLGTAYIRIAPQTEGIRSTIQNAMSRAGSDGGDAFNKGFSLKAGAIAGAISAVTQKAITAITNQFDAAVSRVDTLNVFPKVMKNLGYETDESTESLNRLSTRIEGLPTTLDEIVTYTQRLASSMNSLAKGEVNATDLALAFNDAALSGGKGQVEANRAFEQFVQIIGRGRPMMQDWKIMLEVMPGQLKQMAKYMASNNKSLQEYAKAAGKTADTLDGMDLYEWISEEKNAYAKERLADFTQAMITLDKEGGAGIASFQNQVKDSTQTIGTALRLIPVRITKALASVIEAFGAGDIYTAIDKFTKSFKSIGDWVVKYIVPVVKQDLLPLLVNVAKWVKNVAQSILGSEQGRQVLLNLLKAFLAFKAVKAVVDFINPVFKGFVALFGIIGNLTTAVATFTKVWKTGATFSTAMGAVSASTKGATSAFSGFLAKLTATKTGVAAALEGLAVLGVGIAGIVVAIVGLVNEIDLLLKREQTAANMRKYAAQQIVNEDNALRQLNKAREIESELLDTLEAKKRLQNDAEYQELQAKQNLAEAEKALNDIRKDKNATSDQVRMKELELKSAQEAYTDAVKAHEEAVKATNVADEQLYANMLTGLHRANQLTNAQILQDKQYGTLAKRLDEMKNKTIEYQNAQGETVRMSKKDMEELSNWYATELGKNDAIWKQIVTSAKENGMSFVEAAQRMGKLAGEGQQKNFAAGIDEYAPMVYDAAENTIESTINKVKEQATKGFKIAGILSASGIVAGLDSSKKTLEDGIGRMVGTLVGSFRTRMGIFSPSRVFMGFGQMIDRGLIQGLDSYSDQIEAKAEDIANSVIDPFNRQAQLDMNATGSGLYDRPSQFQAEATSPMSQVIQNNTFNQVADDLDVKEASKLLGFEVATAI